MTCCARDGINAERHFVLSAPAPDLAAIEAVLGEAGVARQRLPVPFAFHSLWIEPAGPASRGVFAFRPAAAAWPCWSSCTAGRIEDEAGPQPWRIARESMRVAETLRGIEAAGGATYIDLGPSGSMAAIVPQLLAAGSPSRAMPVLSPFGDNRKRLSDIVQAVAA